MTVAGALHVPTPTTSTGPVRVMVLYATMFGATELVAEQVAAELRSQLEQDDVPCRDVAYLDLTALAGFDLLVLGLCTWNIGQLPSDLETRLPELAALDLSGKLLALFGTGDAVGYPDTFLDALDIVDEALQPTGATRVGSWPVRGYTFTASLAQRGDEFLGLGIDEDNERELTEERVKGWVAKLLSEYHEAAAAMQLDTAAAG